MKVKSIRRIVCGTFAALFLVSYLVFSPAPVLALDNGQVDQPEKYSRGELAQMLAPVALYPDVLLTHVLMASTYPVEVVEAERWIRKNPKLTAENLDDQLLEQPWDPSVKALCHFPSILKLMSERISETAKIGDAFLAQEADVMDVVQELRDKANWQGTLVSSAEQKVVVEKETVIIEPRNPGVVYVPYYDPYWAYGPWWYPAYPPWYWGPPGVYVRYGVSYWPPFYFSFAFGSWGYISWPRRCVYIYGHKKPRYVKHDQWKKKSGRWGHSRAEGKGRKHSGDKPYKEKQGRHSDRSGSISRNLVKDGENASRRREGYVDSRSRIDRHRRGSALSETERDRKRRTGSGAITIESPSRVERVRGAGAGTESGIRHKVERRWRGNSTGSRGVVVKSRRGVGEARMFEGARKHGSGFGGYRRIDNGSGKSRSGGRGRDMRHWSGDGSSGGDNLGGGTVYRGGRGRGSSGGRNFGGVSKSFR